MSNSTKTILWIVLAVVVVLGAWWWFASQNNGPQNTASPTVQSNAGAPAAASAQNQTIVSTSTSDTSLDQDLANTDSQLGGLASDSAAVDDSLNQSTTAQ